MVNTLLNAGVMVNTSTVLVTVLVVLYSISVLRLLNV
jgi:hypothetical protein